MGTALSLCMSLCGCVGVCLCMPVCRQWGTDAERCVLIFAWRWAPLAVMLGCSDVTHVSLPNIQLRYDGAGWSKCHVYSFLVFTLSLLLCHPLPVTHSFVVWYTLDSLFLLLCTPHEWCLMRGKSSGMLGRNRFSFHIWRCENLVRAQPHFLFFKFHSSCMPLRDWHCRCSCYPPFFKLFLHEQPLT